MDKNPFSWGENHVFVNSPVQLLKLRECETGKEMKLPPLPQESEATYDVDVSILQSVITIIQWWKLHNISVFPLEKY